MKKILISADNPNKNRVSIPVELQGGDPWFGFIWIEDICFIILKTKNSYKIKKY